METNDITFVKKKRKETKRSQALFVSFCFIRGVYNNAYIHKTHGITHVWRNVSRCIVIVIVLRTHPRC